MRTPLPLRKERTCMYVLMEGACPFVPGGIRAIKSEELESQVMQHNMMSAGNEVRQWEPRILQSS